MALSDYLREKVFRLKMSLPGWMQLRLAGGKPVVARGRNMDPSLQLLAHMSAKQPSLDSYPVSIARAAAAAGFAAFSGPVNESVVVQNTVIDADGFDLEVRIYASPESSNAKPIVLYYHPGGWVIGDLDSGHAFCTEICAASRATVISVGYRLAPEHKFPAAANDAIAAYYWVLENAASYDCDPAKIIVAGESAGGNLAAVVCQQAKHAGRQQPLCQFLVSPVTDVKNRSASYKDLSDAFPLNASLMEWFIASYIATEKQAGDPKASPLLATDVSGLAPAIVVTAGFDPLVDEGEAYAKKLEAAGVEVQYHCETRAGHGILTMAGVSRSCRAASDRCIKMLVDRIAAIA